MDGWVDVYVLLYYSMCVCVWGGGEGSVGWGMVGGWVGGWVGGRVGG
jgi:hypothetical protein